VPSRATTPVVPALEQFPLWGGQAVVAVSERAAAAAALTHVKRVVAAFDVACSSFRDDSELALLNASPDEEVVVSSLLFKAVKEALRAARLTDGAVDPTVGLALVAHGINPTMSDRTVRVAAVPGYTTVKLNESRNSVTLASGVGLDLGATTKALAADVAAQAAASAAGCGVLVGLCGDIAVAGTPPDGGWEVRVTDDHRRGGDPGQTVRVSSGGLATSSVTVRRSTVGTEVVHHLIDPSTGRPAVGPWRTVSTTAESCLDANVASTAAIVIGVDAPEWLERHRIPARLVAHDDAVRYTAGWPSEGDDL
jgi:thiamine biosynthesis lipoprotein